MGTYPITPPTDGSAYVVVDGISGGGLFHISIFDRPPLQTGSDYVDDNYLKNTAWQVDHRVVVDPYGILSKYESSLSGTVSSVTPTNPLPSGPSSSGTSVPSTPTPTTITKAILPTKTTQIPFVVKIGIPIAIIGLLTYVFWPRKHH